MNITRKVKSPISLVVDLLQKLSYEYGVIKYQLPHELSPWIEKHLRPLGFSLTRPRELVPHILKASELYQNQASVTKWSEDGSRAAYLAYFFPLNFIRGLKVMGEALSWNMLNRIEEIYDYGCGPGTLSKSLMHYQLPQIRKITGFDSTDVGQYFLDQPRQNMDMIFSQKEEVKFNSKTLVVASYTLNEMAQIPAFIGSSDQFIIIEPSTKTAFENLQKIRNLCLEKNYQIIAPCPHHDLCPLSQNPKDWCHDRVYWTQPDWFENLEKLLPIKNKSLTFSYLMASKHPIAKENYIRVVGDAQVEKGKTRWMICQNNQREFLSHLKRQGKSPLIYRGDKLQLSEQTKKADEIRYENTDLKKIL